jgi:hypothetical protein
MSELRTTYLGTLGLAAFFLAVAVGLVAGGAVDERVTPLWNPAFLAAAGLGPAYAAPRMSLRTLFVGGVALGLFYGGMVIVVASFVGSVQAIAPVQLVLWAGATGALPPVAAGLFYRWFERRSRRSPVGR